MGALISPIRAPFQNKPLNLQVVTCGEHARQKYTSSATAYYPVLSASMLGAFSFTYVHVQMVRSTTVRNALKSKRADIEKSQ